MAPYRAQEAPLWGGTARDIDLIWGKREAEYFCKGGWTGMVVICPTGTFFAEYSPPQLHERGGSDEAIRFPYFVARYGDVPDDLSAL